jgi:hypothetical protein
LAPDLLIAVGTPDVRDSVPARMAINLRPLFSGSVALLLGSCSAPPPAPPPPSPTVSPPVVAGTPVAAAIELGATPLALDDRGVPHLVRGTPSMAKLPAADASTSARLHAQRLAPVWGVKPAAMPELVSLGEVALAGGTIVRLRQVIDGIPVDTDQGGELRVMVGSDGALIAAGGAAIAGDLPHLATAPVITSDAAAIAHAVGAQFKTGFAPSALAMTAAATDGTRRLAGQAGSINVSMARARPVWFPEAGQLTKAWSVEAYAGDASSSTSQAFRTVIAEDGRTLKTTDLTADAAFTYRVFAEPTGELHPLDGPLTDVTPNATGVPNTTPFPPYLLPNLVTVDGLNHPAGRTAPDPWLAAGRTETIGNNVEAYTDINPPDGLTFGDFRATITSAATFDRTYATALSATASQDQQMAGITSLFYLINWLHDFWYDAGFTEAAGNGQNNNLGRGGEDRDALLAEAQDNANNGSRNNANMSTPADGMPPRMQVFVWDGIDDRSLGISRRKPATGGAGFGPKHFTTTGDVVLADDGTATTTDACSPLVASVTTKIVLADRGNCTFKTKALNVQNAGGVGLLIANNVDAPAPPSLGDDTTLTATITIGVFGILKTEGTQIKAELLDQPAVSATMHRDLGPDLEGTLDATVIAHENGHYVHHRLTSCNTMLCGAMSEGWGDFAGLLVTSRAGDDFNKAFPVGVYSTASFPADPVYYGIRRSPYSANHAINALSFRHMAVGEPLPPAPFNGGDPAGNNEVHNGGEVWASMMWEGYAALQQQPGASFEAVRLKMRQYVVGGLLLAPTDATPTETRDAILAVAEAASPADHDVLAAAYARRGFGSCAISPPRASTTFVGIVESSEVKGRIETGAPTVTMLHDCDQDGVLDAGDSAVVSLAIANAGGAALADLAVALTTTTPGVHVDSPAVALGALAAAGGTTVSFTVSLDDSVTGIVPGDFTLAITAGNACTASLALPLALRLNSDDVPASSEIDRFDTTDSVWTATGGAGLWSHERRTVLDGFWLGSDAAAVSDASLTSPPLTAGTNPLTLKFVHRFSFQATGATAFDGGVIEYSIDDGATWQDLSTIASPGYNATLDGTPANTGNPLAGRSAFGLNSPSYPGVDTAVIDLGTALAGHAFRLRFRIGSNATTGAPGWEIDNVLVAGVVGTPFPSLEPDTGSCAPPQDGPRVDAGAPPVDGPIVVDGATADTPPVPTPDAPPAPTPDAPPVPADASVLDGHPDAPIIYGPSPDAGYPSPGGGGCQVGGTTSGAGLALGLCAVLLRRRRR